MLKWVQSANRYVLAIFLFLAIFFIGSLDYISGQEVVFSAFYALPIIGVTYILDKKSGIAASLLSCILAGITDYSVILKVSPVIGWNFISRLLLFLTITFLISFLKKKIEVERQAAEIQRFMIKEIHHRLSNNMATTVGILHLQMINEKNSVPFLMPLERRLTAMLNIHKKLYQQTGLVIHLREYLQELVSSFSETYQLKEEKININLYCDPIDIIDTKAQTIGMLINELMINSKKYAFPNAKTGLIQIRVSYANKKITIIYEDNGIGFDYVKNTPTNGIGMQLIEGFAKELNASITFQKTPGVQFKFEFPNGENPSLNPLNT